MVENSDGYMYVEPRSPRKDGGLWSWSRKWLSPGSRSSARNRRVSERFLIKTHMKKKHLAEGTPKSNIYAEALTLRGATCFCVAPSLDVLVLLTEEQTKERRNELRSERTCQRTCSERRNERASEGRKRTSTMRVLTVGKAFKQQDKMACSAGELK